MKELFIKEVLDSTNHFLDNNQRIKLKEKLIEICLNYQIEIKEQAKSQETQKNNADILKRFISAKEIEGCVCVLSGQSGVGKSTLINYYTGLNIKTDSI